jgi:hypothetical protein
VLKKSSNGGIALQIWRKKMRHLNDGQLRASLDGQVGEEERLHLAHCAECQARLVTIEQRAKRLQSKFSFLVVPQREESTQASRTALARFKNRLIEKKEKSMFQKMFASRILRFSLAVALLLVIALSFPSTRAWAGEFLGLFRIQQVAVIPIDTTGMEKLNGNTALSKQIGQLLSSSMKVTQKPGEPKAAADASEATSLAGFAVRLPQNPPSAPSLSVTGSTGVEFVVDRGRAQALLDEAGRKDLVLPKSIDGANISVHIPSGMRAAYGTCPDLKSEDSPNGSGPDSNSNGFRSKSYPDCILLAEIPSPTVNTPPDVNLQQLAELGLEFTGMTAEQAKAFSQTVDWTSSLVIPIPKNAATYKQISVDGVTGTLIERPANDAPQFLLVWVKDGVVYTIGGSGSHSDEAIQMANSLQ